MSSLQAELDKIPQTAAPWKLRLDLAAERAYRAVERDSAERIRVINADFHKSQTRILWCLVVAFALFGASMGCTLGIAWVRSKAVEHKAAHWEVSDSGTPSFHWNTEEAPK